MTKKNYFITLEGCEGVGKSTALEFIKSLLRDNSINFIATREPGGTPIAEAIRNILLTKDTETLTPESESLLMFASRSQHIEHVIKPALANGKTVLCDRFVDASLAYQGGGRQIPMPYLQSLSDMVLKDTKPDLTLLLDAPIEIGLARMEARGEKDRIESEGKAFFQRIRDAYLKLAKDNSERVKIIDASQSIENVQAQIKAIIKAFLQGDQ